MNNKTKALIYGTAICATSVASYQAVKKYKAYARKKSKEFSESIKEALQEGFESLEGKI